MDVMQIFQNQQDILYGLLSLNIKIEFKLDKINAYYTFFY